MIGLVEAPRAFWMAHGMARRRGVHLAHAVVQGWLTRAELRRMVERCQTCPSVGACEIWLGDPCQDAGPPSFCAIGADVVALAPSEEHPRS